MTGPFSVKLESLRAGQGGGAPAPGGAAHRDVVHSRTLLRDLSWAFEKPPHADAGRREHVVYETYEPATSADGALLFSLDIIHPGDSGGECFMTKGHRHSRPDADEVYYGISGRGLMVCMSPAAGETVTVPVEPGTVTYVPPGWAHRTVNVGDEDLVFLTVYPRAAGHDYEAVRRRGFGLRVLRGAEGPVVVRSGHPGDEGGR